ncbi:MAG TPA: HAMP domain-containing sensor histidine kinase [Streptosporangiaceae bacterium]|nr:HAMP domain-containing sensor histidine kinase [Streptosporangiaceae bacterium]
MPCWRGRLRRRALGRLVWRRTLSARLIAGVLVLLIVACAVIGVATYVVLRGSLVSSLDNQLAAASNTYMTCAQAALDSHVDSDGPAQSDPPRCSGGLAQDTLGVVIQNGQVQSSNTVYGVSQKPCVLSAADEKALLRLPAHYVPKPPDTDDQHSYPPPSAGAGPGPAYTVHLTSLDGDYRVTAIKMSSGVILITGLPMSPVQHTLGQVAIAELIVFLSVLLLAGVLGTMLVRVSLRPLRRVAAIATQVTELPLDSGDVSLPAGVPDSDPRTEVGQVGAAFNRMLGHVERALGRRAASEARLRRFAADASHELRTPLSAIRGYAEFALRHASEAGRAGGASEAGRAGGSGPVPDEVTHALSRVQSESARMSVLVDDLLLLARLDAGRPLDRAPVDLSRLAIDATSDARVARGDRRWRLDLPDDPVLVEGDEHRLHQVLANLLSNAGKHTPPGTTVTVALAVTDQLAEMSVTDDGPGIPADLIPDLFERFTRADTSRSRNADSAGTSTGLGLAIVDAVVSAHGGTVTAHSMPGNTRFIVTLPVLRREECQK